MPQPTPVGCCVVLSLVLSAGPAQNLVTPFRYNQPVYSKKTQFVTYDEAMLILLKHSVQQIKSKMGTFLYYGRGVDPTILTALNEMSTEQAKPTATTKKDLSILMDYLATYPNATIRYVAGTIEGRIRCIVPHDERGKK